MFHDGLIILLNHNPQHLSHVISLAVNFSPKLPGTILCWKRQAVYGREKPSSFLVKVVLRRNKLIKEEAGCMVWLPRTRVTNFERKEKIRGVRNFREEKERKKIPGAIERAFYISTINVSEESKRRKTEKLSSQKRAVKPEEHEIYVG